MPWPKKSFSPINFPWSLWDRPTEADLPHPAIALMTESLTLRIRRLNPERDRDLPIPEYMSPGASGLDLPAAIEEEITLAPGEIRLIPTGLALAIPTGFEGQIRPRSGLALKHGITLINTPGPSTPITGENSDWRLSIWDRNLIPSAAETAWPNW